MARYIGLILFIIIIITAAINIGWSLGSSDCSNGAAKMKLENYYSLMHGCYVKQNGIWHRL